MSNEDPIDDLKSGILDDGIKKYKYKKKMLKDAGCNDIYFPSEDEAKERRHGSEHKKDGKNRDSHKRKHKKDKIKIRKGRSGKRTRKEEILIRKEDKNQQRKLPPKYFEGIDVESDGEDNSRVAMSVHFISAIENTVEEENAAALKDTPKKKPIDCRCPTLSALLVPFGQRRGQRHGRNSEIL